MRLHSVVLALVMVSAGTVASAAPAAPEAARPAEREPPPLHMVSSIPRWPWILGACVVFAGMCVLGLRRRS